ncbi:MAG: redoxin family protein [Candidatus Eremiobacteraeota bacterium]|nr:redoxin family protein [Candidatus Eremiobacteraeota bacterium]
MNQRLLAIVSAIVLAVVIVGAIAWYHFGSSHRLTSASQAPIVGKAAVGQPAPPFAVATTDGLFDLSKTEKPVFLEVFATWCPHCQRETVIIDKLYRTYRSRVDFVGVSGSDTAMDNTSPASQLDVLNWVQRFNVRYPVAYDASLNVANSYLQGGFPTIAIIDKSKMVAYLNSGEIAYNDLASALQKALR